MSNNFEKIDKELKDRFQTYKKISNYHISKGKNVVADFICPTKATRDDFDADFLIE